MINVLVAPDKFKGSLTAPDICDLISEFLQTKKKYSIKTVPLADGGEGTFEILLNHFHGYPVEAIVHDPLMRKIRAPYGISGDGATAFIEMAKASGLSLLNVNERNPLVTTTFGTGELIADALSKGVRNIVLGIGGSATNDAGVGMASALGFRFYDNEKEFTPRGGIDVGRITQIDRSAQKQFTDVNIVTLCDVKNPLTGSSGASHTFAPQKGATPGEVAELENNLIRFGNLLQSRFSFDTNFDGAGAAGGLGAGAKFFLNSKMMSGMDYIAQATRLEALIWESDIVITGEGKLDEQSLNGKVVASVSRLARSNGKQVIVVCGACTLTENQLMDLGIDECLELSENVTSAYSMENAPMLIRQRLTESKVLSDL